MTGAALTTGALTTATAVDTTVASAAAVDMAVAVAAEEDMEARRCAETFSAASVSARTVASATADLVVLPLRVVRTDRPNSSRVTGTATSAMRTTSPHARRAIAAKRLVAAALVLVMTEGARLRHADAATAARRHRADATAARRRRVDATAARLRRADATAATPRLLAVMTRTMTDERKAMTSAVTKTRAVAWMIEVLCTRRWRRSFFGMRNA